jgi:hypothetical protein
MKQLKEQIENLTNDQLNDLQDFIKSLKSKQTSVLLEKKPTTYKIIS